MLRFIVQRNQFDSDSGLERKDFLTVDVDSEELEGILTRGGRGEMGFDLWSLVGVEILDKARKGGA